ncbi:MAG: DUF4197 domain-containing protein [Maricaulaceae bacterium]|nr:DUF4197 domain-containing protein [Maricaulaceae bacterium]
MHRRTFVISAAAFLIAAPAQAQGFGRLSERDAAGGVREALSVASRLATRRLGRTDGFFGDPAVRIPLPGVMRTAQRNLRNLGLSGPLDDVELRMNRAAEAAMPAAADIFMSAIRSISITDAVGIVRGGDTAATQFLRGRTEPQLTGLMRPPMQETLEVSGAYRAVDGAAGLVGERGGGLGALLGAQRTASPASLRDQVTDFAVERAISGVFHYVGEEERAIRRDPVNRTTNILRRVFG